MESISWIWGILLAIVLQIIAFAYGYGQLSQKVKAICEGMLNMKKDIQKTLETFKCPAHDQINEKVIRAEERAVAAKELAITVAVARKQAQQDEKAHVSRLEDG